MPKWFLGKRRHKSPPSYDQTSPTVELNLYYGFMKDNIDSSIYHQPGLLLQESAAKKCMKTDEDSLNREGLSRASLDSGYSHSPISYSYCVDHDNPDIECNGSAASLNSSNHPLDLRIKTCSTIHRQDIYETTHNKFDFHKSEPPNTDSVYEDLSQKRDSSKYQEYTAVVYDSKTKEGGKAFNDISLIDCDIAPPRSQRSTSRHIYLDINDGKQFQPLIGDESVCSGTARVINSVNNAAQLSNALLCGQNTGQKRKSKKKLRCHETTNSNGKQRKGFSNAVHERHEHLNNNNEINTRQLVGLQLFSQEMNELQNSRRLDSVTYRRPDLQVLSSEIFGVRYKQSDQQTVPMISDIVETKHESIIFDEKRQSEKCSSSVKCATASRITQTKKPIPTKTEKSSITSKSSKLAQVKQDNVNFNCDDVESFCRGDLDTSLTFVDATPEARAEIEKIENKIGDYACMLCCEIFSDAFQLAGHNCAGIVHVEYRCPECSKTFNCPANLASHRRWHKPQRPPPTEMSEWSLDELLHSSHYLDRIRKMGNFGKPLLL